MRVDVSASAFGRGTLVNAGSDGKTIHRISRTGSGIAQGYVFEAATADGIYNGFIFPMPTTTQGAY
jgi:pectin methylesterase-like acyl-CoA thioesterase